MSGNPVKIKFRFTIGRKIGTGFGVLIFFTILAFLLTQYTLKESREKTDLVTYVYNPSVNKLEKLNTTLVRSKMLVSKWYYFQSSDDSPEKEELRSLIKEDYPQLRKELEILSLKWKPEGQNGIKDIFSLVDGLFKTYENDIMSQLNSFSSYDDPTVKFMVVFPFEEIDVKSKVIYDNLSKLIVMQQTNAAKVTSEMLDSFDFLQFVVLSTGFTLLFGGILIAIFTVRTIVTPIQQLKKILLMLAKGIFPKKLIKKRSDEIGEMSNALSLMVDGLKRTTNFSKEVGSGNFDSYYEPLSEEDTLGLALLKMRDELRENERILEEKVRLRTEEVVRQKEEIESQSIKLGVLYKHVTDSIKYAKRIQEAILPPDRVFKALLPKSFVLYKPKDIVSGDFYWLKEKDGKVYVAAVDCTGHGVPGAFMSIVGYNILRQVVNEVENVQPDEVLNGLSKGVSETLNQGNHEGSTKDGMDVSLCSIDYKNKVLEYAGAYNPLYVIRNNEVIETKGDKFPVGMFVGNNSQNFTNHKIQLQEGDTIYIFSDGYADQFGGPHGKKFMAKQFRNLLLEIQKQGMQEQRITLDKAIETWRGNQEQVDDILVMGIRI